MIELLNCYKVLSITLHQFTFLQSLTPIFKLSRILHCHMSVKERMLPSQFDIVIPCFVCVYVWQTLLLHYNTRWYNFAISSRCRVRFLLRMLYCDVLCLYVGEKN